MALSFSKLVGFSLTESFYFSPSTPKNLTVMICLVLKMISKKEKNSVLFLSLYLPNYYMVKFFKERPLPKCFPSAVVS